MAYVFAEVKDAQGAPAGWRPSRLDEQSPLALSGPTCEADGTQGADQQHQDELAVLAAVSVPGTQGTWAVLCGPKARVTINGRPVALGIHVLDHRDQIVVDCAGQAGANRWYFSSEEPAVIEPYPGPESVVCPRCKTPIEPGDPAVRCPACHFWHHQIEAGSSAPGDPAPTDAAPDRADSQEYRRPRPCWT